MESVAGLPWNQWQLSRGIRNILAELATMDLTPFSDPFLTPFSSFKIQVYPVVSEPVYLAQGEPSCYQPQSR